MTEFTAKMPGPLPWMRILVWALVCCVCMGGIPRAATASAARLKQAHAGSYPQKSTTHKFKAGRLSEPQKWILWSPGPGDLRPTPITFAPAELPLSLYAALPPSALPARAPPSLSQQS
jgi:hypothetical protein